MAFGQAAGPPAQQRQLDELSALFDRAGFSSFKEARHPYGLNQRQAGGRFTADEAAELIERLTAAEAVKSSVDDESVPTGRSEPAVARPPRSAASKAAERARSERLVQTLSGLDDSQLVSELERRGWCCIPPVIDGD